MKSRRLNFVHISRPKTSKIWTSWQKKKTIYPHLFPFITEAFLRKRGEKSFPLPKKNQHQAYSAKELN